MQLIDNSFPIELGASFYTSSVFEHSAELQRLLNIISIEGDIDLICEASDFYYFDEVSDIKLFDVGEKLGAMTENLPTHEQLVWEFVVPPINVRVYFIGSKDTVKKRIEYIL